MRTALLSSVALSLGLACTAMAQGPAAEPAAPDAPPAYMAQAPFDITRVLPGAPVRGTARFEGDRAVFRDTRALVGSPRWDAAIADVKEDQADLFKSFSCALGVEADPLQMPALARVTGRAVSDFADASGAAKAFFQRERPPVNDAGATCHALSERDLTRDYPSGHAGRSWLYALILAELAPDRATDILVRGRSFGESRVVCGVHNASAIEAGRVTGASVVAVLHSDPTFRADMDAARAELASARISGVRPPLVVCAATAALLAPTPF